MTSGISYVQDMVALSASEGASIKTEDGKDKIETGEKKRKELEQKIQAKMEEIDDLSKELEEASDKSGFESFCCWLVGSDGGVSDLQRDISTAQAEMQKAQENLKVEQARLEMELQELQAAYGEFDDRSSGSKEIQDEADKTVAMAWGE